MVHLDSCRDHIDNKGARPRHAGLLDVPDSENTLNLKLHPLNKKELQPGKEQGNSASDGVSEAGSETYHHYPPADSPTQRNNLRLAADGKEKVH